MPAITHAGARVYAAALRLYPPGFRREFSADLSRDFDEATEEAWLAGSWSGLLRLWAHLGGDFARTVVAQWIRTGLPVLCLSSVLGALVAASLAAGLRPNQPLAAPEAAADRDLLALICLVGTVLLIIAATILFTFWFLRPRLGHRHR